MGISEPLFVDKEPLDRESFDLAAWSQKARKSGIPVESRHAEMIRRVNEIRQSRPALDPTTQDVLMIGDNQTVTLRRPDGTETPFLPSFDIEHY